MLETVKKKKMKIVTLLQEKWNTVKYSMLHLTINNEKQIILFF